MGEVKELKEKYEHFEAVKLISCDNHEFIMDKNIAFECETFRRMYESSMREGMDGVIRLPTITGRILEKVLQYLYYKFKFTYLRSRPPSFPLRTRPCWIS